MARRHSGNLSNDYQVLEFSIICLLEYTLLPRHEFEKQASRIDGQRRSDALSRWSQFVALTIGQLGGRRSLRDIEATVQSQKHHRYHLGSQSISRSALRN